MLLHDDRSRGTRVSVEVRGKLTRFSIEIRDLPREPRQDLGRSLASLVDAMTREARKPL